MSEIYTAVSKIVSDVALKEHNAYASPIVGFLEDKDKSLEFEVELMYGEKLRFKLHYTTNEDNEEFHLYITIQALTFIEDTAILYYRDAIKRIDKLIESIYAKAPQLVQAFKIEEKSN